MSTNTTPSRERPAKPVEKKRDKDQPEWLEQTDTHAIITLNVPIEVSGVKISQLKMRRPKLKDRREADRQFGDDEHAAEEKELFMFTSLTDMTPDELEELDLDDYVRMQQAFQGFLSSARQRRYGGRS